MNKSLRVLIIEDDENDALIVVRTIERNGYAVTCERVETADALKAALDGEPWDVVIADFTLPQLLGTEALAIVHKTSDFLPFIFVSGTIGEETAVLAMKGGAYDYVMKDDLIRLVPAIERALHETEERKERIRVEQRVRHLAYYDWITDLPNYVQFWEKLQQAVQAAKHRHDSVGLLVMKLDYFRKINDTLGYQAANDLLKEVGSRLRSELAESLLVASLRTNEFAILLPSAHNTQDVLVAAKSVLRAFERPFPVGEASLEIQATIGGACFPEHAPTAEALIQRAHIALSAAKKQYTRVAVYSPKQELNNAQDLAVVGGLRRAIAEKQFYLLYQPKVDYKSGRIVGTEALSRWKHPEFGLISPDRFIPLAESTGLTPRLTRWVFQEALGQCRAWNDKKFAIRIAVNLSMHDLQAPDFTGWIGDLVASSDVSSNQLIFEITESAIMANPERAMESVKRMKNMGFRLSIDDFGTGYSSLAYLRKLSPDEVKIDKSFVVNMTAHPEDAVIVRAIIDLGHELGMEVVAEGVEDQDTMEMLGKLGCDAAQGYYISRPLPAAELTPLLNRSNWISALAAGSSRSAKSKCAVRLPISSPIAGSRPELVDR
jgi:diguanylate cyclase (GGDEF)-like protein